MREARQRGLLSERREQTGRRRRLYRLTAAGRKALEQWRLEPETKMYELRDPRLLKPFGGADPATLAPLQLERHRERLRGYQQLAREAQLSDGMRLVLESEIGHEREYVRFWQGVLKRNVRTLVDAHITRRHHHA